MINFKNCLTIAILACSTLCYVEQIFSSDNDCLGIAIPEKEFEEGKDCSYDIPVECLKFYPDPDNQSICRPMEFFTSKSQDSVAVGLNEDIFYCKGPYNRGYYVDNLNLIIVIGKEDSGAWHVGYFALDTPSIRFFVEETDKNNDAFAKLAESIWNEYQEQKESLNSIRNPPFVYSPYVPPIFPEKPISSFAQINQTDFASKLPPPPISSFAQIDRPDFAFKTMIPHNSIQKFHQSSDGTRYVVFYTPGFTNSCFFHSILPSLSAFFPESIQEFRNPNYLAPDTVRHKAMSLFKQFILSDKISPEIIIPLTRDIHCWWTASDCPYYNKDLVDNYLPFEVSGFEAIVKKVLEDDAPFVGDRVLAHEAYKKSCLDGLRLDKTVNLDDNDIKALIADYFVGTVAAEDPVGALYYILDIDSVIAGNQPSDIVGKYMQDVSNSYYNLFNALKTDGIVSLYLSYLDTTGIMMDSGTGSLLAMAHALNINLIVHDMESLNEDGTPCIRKFLTDTKNPIVHVMSCGRHFCKMLPIDDLYALYLSIAGDDAVGPEIFETWLRLALQTDGKKAYKHNKTFMSQFHSSSTARSSSSLPTLSNDDDDQA